MKLFLAALIMALTTQASASALNFQRISKTFGATGSTTVLISKYQYSFYYSIASNTASTILLEKSNNGGTSWSTVSTFTNANGTGVIKNLDVGSSTVQYRFRCSAYTSGSPVAKLNEIPFYPNGKEAKRMQFSAGGLSKRLTASAFSIDNSATSSLVTLAASQTDAKMIFHVPGLPVGSVVKGFNLVGQAESAGNNISMDASFAVATSVSTDVSEATHESMTRLSLTDDAVIGAANTEKIFSEPRVLNEDENMYIILTVTTAASTDLALQGFVIEYDEP